jgi:hypothetical protein
MLITPISWFTESGSFPLGRLLDVNVCNGSKADTRLLEKYDFFWCLMADAKPAAHPFRRSRPRMLLQ